MNLDLSQFHDVFRLEANGLVDRIEAGLARLEAGSPDPHQAGVVFRAAHSLKGAASALAIAEIRDLARSIEAAFDPKRSGPIDDDLLSAAAAATLLLREMIPVLDQASDSLRAAVGRVRAHLDERAMRPPPEILARNLAGGPLKLQELPR